MIVSLKEKLAFDTRCELQCVRTVAIDLDEQTHTALMLDAHKHNQDIGPRARRIITAFYQGET